MFYRNPKGSINKYEFDKETNQIKLDRVLYSPVYWPFEYGFIENTLSEDGDPLDVVVLAEHATFPGCVVPCKVIGMLNMEDEGGVDYKILAVPDDKLIQFQEINSLDDLTEYQKR